ncbi:MULTISPECIES: methylated-DNA--[protein]-cysteine S-methyltransferase [unclassified Streptomyces]|uniref:methylated-DNA--[protein]-cysteine S-methyltransferase n=1 Tax=unclassified Streptomyces TaxID=2593676 RepID=UPI00386799AD
MTMYATVDSPLGELLLVGEEAPGSAGIALVSLSLPGQKGAAVVQDGWAREPSAFAGVAGQLREYFEGHRTRFELVYAPGRGTEFQRRVWAAVEAVPYGETASYGQIAERVGASGAGVRAVGTAIGRNPLLVVRPCHRVIGADGALRGYAAGLERKERLLGLEGALQRGERLPGLDGAAQRKERLPGLDGAALVAR